MFLKGDQWLWLKMEADRAKNGTECYRRYWYSVTKYDLPSRTVSLIVAYDWEGKILMHVMSAGQTVNADYC